MWRSIGDLEEAFMRENNTRNMTEGNVMRVLLLFTVPIFISNLFQQLYNVVDVAVIGHYHFLIVIVAFSNT